jgi:hypothetical protein
MLKIGCLDETNIAKDTANSLLFIFKESRVFGNGKECGKQEEVR